jgi:peptidoglycan hydrolase-like protein with peptidoglycan-binding domain
MNNIEQYRKRFYNLMESTMGDVKPLIVEKDTHVKDFQYMDGKFTGILTDGKPDGWGDFINKNNIKYTGNFESGMPIDRNDEQFSWDEINNITTDSEMHQFRSDKLPSGYHRTWFDDDIYKCQAYLDEAEKDKTYNPCNLVNGKIALRVGSKGPLVQYVQCLLNRLMGVGGWDNLVKLGKLEEDGKYGQLTKKAVETFQEINNKASNTKKLTVDGVVGKNTIGELTMGGNIC